jgi:hypothetical protein
MNTNLTTCKNCDNAFDGNFCNQCGQKSRTNRISFGYILDEIQNLVFQVDKGFFYTLKKLSLYPGNAIRYYIEGKRVNYFKPTSFVVLLSIVYAILESFKKSDPLTILFLKGFFSTLDNNPNDSKDGFTLRVMQWLIDNYSYTVLLLIPVFSLASFLAFRKAKYNYFENLVLNMYTFGIITFYSILPYPILYFSKGDLADFTHIGVVLILTFYTYYQFFNSINKTKRILNTFVTYVLFILFSAILSFAIVGLTIQ